MSFLLMWEALLRGLGTPGFFGVIVSRTESSNFDVGEVKPIALAYYDRDAQSFSDEWDPARVLHDDAGGCRDVR